MEHEIFIRDVLVIDKRNSVMVGADVKAAKDVSDENLNSYFKRALKAAAEMYDKPVLVTQTDVTHYGFVNSNYRRYRLEFIKANARTWTQDYEKPVQINHDDGDVDKIIGRVLFAVPVIYNQTQQERDNIAIPSGHITVYSAIVDPVGIEKIMDGRYLTVSMGARSTDVQCSICGKHPLSFECEHSMGKTYPTQQEGSKKTVEKLAFADFGKKYYSEYSYISAPGDKLARTGRYELTTSSADAMLPASEMVSKGIGKFDIPDRSPKMKFFFGDSSRTSEILTAVRQCSITDSDHNPDILLYDFKGLDKLSTSEKTKDKIVPKETHATKTDKDKTTGDVVTDPETDQHGSSNEGEPKGEQEDTMTKKYAVLHLIHSLLSNDNTDLQGALEELSKVDFKVVGDDLTKEKVLAEIDKELDEMEAEDAKKDEKDRVLTTKIRKSLSKTTFCGPNRSWPVPDCQHVATARSYLANSMRTKNLTAAQKARIRACVNRKAKALGCDKGKNDNGGNDEYLFTSIEEMLNSEPVALAIDELVSEREMEIERLEDKLTKTYIGQILDYGTRLKKVWATDEKKRDQYVTALKQRSIDSLENTLDDLRVEAGSENDQDSQNNGKLDQATNDKNETDKDKDKDKDGTAGKLNADETVTNPKEKTGDKQEIEESVLARSGAIK